jgi:hypothetical protein
MFEKLRKSAFFSSFFLPMDPDSESGSTKSLNPDPQPCQKDRIKVRTQKTIEVLICWPKECLKCSYIVYTEVITLRTLENDKKCLTFILKRIPVTKSTYLADTKEGLYSPYLVGVHQKMPYCLQVHGYFKKIYVNIKIISPRYKISANI